MIDIKHLRENPDAYRQAANDKNMKADVDELMKLDGELLNITRELQDIRTQQNAAGKKIAQLKGDDKQAAIETMGALKQKVKDLEDRQAELQPTFDALMLQMPLIPSPEAPVGPDESGNVEVRRVGEPRQFNFEIKDHVELGESLGIIDIPRGVKLAGSRNFILCGAGAMLHQAVLRLAFDHMVARGFTPMTVPVLVEERVMEGMGQFPLHRDESYLCERDGLALAGTSEVALVGYHAEEILDEAELPCCMTALSTCFRREAGAAGKDTRGLYRIHGFDKVEQVVLCKADDADSATWHERIIANTEEVMAALELPYRVIEVCTGDMGQGKYRMYDIETWMPSRGSYGETHSASSLHDFQARRLNIRYRDEDGNVQFVHTLNNTVVASPRILIPLLELNQNADGSVTIPEALRSYMQGMERIEPKA
ncbi:MAG: serine--tRNA ligase [Planctomycetes bacterium]|jgi:seryl-tRNA synthetase|nr:serine--tRNA ligase [Phycisphaerae bacterium]NBB96169.1 serine--tRNA ligase [Planctomycetota bacterium]